MPFHVIIQIIGVYQSTKTAFYIYRLASGFVTGTLTVLCFVYGQEILPKSGNLSYIYKISNGFLVWAITGNVMPFVFAIGIAVLAFCGQVLVTAQSIILWESFEKFALFTESFSRKNFVQTSLPFLLCSLLTYHAPESPRWLLACSQRERAAQVFNHLAKMNGQIDHQEPVLKPSQVSFLF